MDKEKVIFTWSGGKDSSMALYELIGVGRYEVVALLTTITAQYDRISMHGVRRELLIKQADAIGIPLREVCITKNGSNEEYELRMAEALSEFKKSGIDKVAFGDIFLEDLRKYREENLAKIGMKGIFPIWKRDTRALAKSFIGLGFKAVVVCVDTWKLSPEFSGMEFDSQFLNKLPEGVDPCGENGEFHTFVYDGPIFKKKVGFRRGERVLKDERFCFCELLSESVKC